ncbi:hypothetical protein [Pedobacter nutrimenti]|uniref:Uncharacterized protein n=1 Tax=Pedobacter nutrimenti TaxID=1241337 RepID=A0A318U9A6_9SPHI|nr:hypothetical protein [Pedobacter nutrimenti]PYF68456.1 hypothetical protein B0O44_11243 [Pedobacter nutrimenti]
MNQVTKEDKFKFAGMMINEGKITTISALYKHIPKKDVAEIIGVNGTKFSNVKSNHPESFKLSDVQKLSLALKVDFLSMAKIFDNSMKQLI